jgi:archaellum biogenesis ATPase FlaH
MQFQIRAPMVINFLAPFKRYKSVVMNHISFAALLQGFNVAQVVFENTIELTEDRLDSLASGLSYERLMQMAVTPDEKQRAGCLFNWMNSFTSRIKVLKCVPYQSTMAQVDEQLERWYAQENFKPDVIVVDYYNIIAPNCGRSGEERIEQGQIIWDIKEVADKYMVPIITASQSNTEGTIADRLQTDHQGKSIGISQGVDLTVAINQTKEERAEGLLVFSPLFMRGFEITIPDVVVDCDINRMAISKDLSELWALAAQNFPYVP